MTGCVNMYEQVAEVVLSLSISLMAQLNLVGVAR
jgi:hypothetical protein